MQVTASDRKIDECLIKKGDIYITPTSETIDDKMCIRDSIS